MSSATWNKQHPIERLAEHLHGADAVVFAAGAGPGSGAARKDTVDRAAAVLLADAAQADQGPRQALPARLLHGRGHTHPPPAHRRRFVWAAYLRAKRAAEDEGVLGNDALDATVLRPGRLTDEPATGRVTLAETPVGHEEVTRADTAATLVALLDAPGTVGRTLELINGTVPLRHRRRRAGLTARLPLRDEALRDQPAPGHVAGIPTVDLDLTDHAPHRGPVEAAGDLAEQVGHGGMAVQGPLAHHRRVAARVPTGR